MRRRSRGQSVVEMAFVLPVLVLVLFGIIDFGYYIYGYATIYQAARNGSEKASKVPPYDSMIKPSLNRSDPCVDAILAEVQSHATLFPDLTAPNGLDSRIQISYPAIPAPEMSGRKLGASIQIDITYNVKPLTPLWNFVTLGQRGTMRVQATSRRSIESLGNNPNTLLAPNLIACKSN